REQSRPFFWRSLATERVRCGGRSAQWGFGRVFMPARSKAQQKAAGAALAAKRGKTSRCRLRGASRGMHESMSEQELDEMASTSRSDKPNRVGGRRKSASSRGGRRTSAKKGRRTSAKKRASSSASKRGGARRTTAKKRSAS